MNKLQIPLIIVSIIFIILILGFYFFIRKKLKRYDEVDRRYIKQQIKNFRFILICLGILIVISIFTIFSNI